jgi:hypothetical protein
MHEAICKMQSAKKFKTPLTLILSPRGERRTARAIAMFACNFTTVVRLLLEKRRGEGDELIVI